MSYDILGIGQPIVDVVINVDEDYLTKLGLEKGGSVLLTYEDLMKIIPDKALSFPSTQVPGGSCANTIKGLASLGEKCALIGKCGRDELGRMYQDSIAKRGVISLFTYSETPTGQVVCLVTPDGQRTMRAYLGASQEMADHDLLPQDFEDVKLFHVEGYSIYNLPLTVKAMSLAKKNKSTVSFDLGSFELVRCFRKTLVELIHKYVDVVFCNEEEGYELMAGKGTPEQTVDYLATLCEVAVVMMGDQGCWVKSGSDKIRCPAKPIKPVDTTGAGDLFISGFLHGYLEGYSLEQCARLGALAGGTVVQFLGAEIPQHEWQRVKSQVNDIMLMEESYTTAFGGNEDNGQARKSSISKSNMAPISASPKISIPQKNGIRMFV